MILIKSCIISSPVLAETGLQARLVQTSASAEKKNSFRFIRFSFFFLGYDSLFSANISLAQSKFLSIVLTDN